MTFLSLILMGYRYWNGFFANERVTGRSDQAINLLSPLNGISVQATKKVSRFWYGIIMWWKLHLLMYQYIYNHHNSCLHWDALFLFIYRELKLREFLKNTLQIHNYEGGLKLAFWYFRASILSKRSNWLMCKWLLASWDKYSIWNYSYSSSHPWAEAI